MPVMREQLALRRFAAMRNRSISTQATRRREAMAAQAKARLAAGETCDCLGCQLRRAIQSATRSGDAPEASNESATAPGSNTCH